MRAFALLWLLPLAGSAAIAASAPVQGERIPLDVELDTARQEAAAAGALQQRAERAAADARDDAARLRLRQVAAAQAIAAEEARITSADMETRLLQARLTAQRQALARERAPVSSLLAGLAMIGQRPPLALLAGAGSTRELIKVKLLVEAIAPEIEARSAALAAQVDQGRALEQAALGARSRAASSRAALEQRKVELAGLEAQALRLADRRGAQALSAGDLVLATEERAAALERRSDGQSLSAARDLAALGPAPARPGGEASPPRPPLAYLLPADAAVTEGLGNISDNGVRSRGITLATRRGAPVAVPASGTILFSGPYRDYDGIVIIDHGGGWRSVMVNIGSTQAKGAKVAIGQPLGVALGPLEVQLNKDGQPVSAALIAGSSDLLSKVR